MFDPHVIETHDFREIRLQSYRSPDDISARKHLPKKNTVLRTSFTNIFTPTPLSDRPNSSADIVS